MDILTSVNLEAVLRAMSEHNQKKFVLISRLWESIIDNLPSHLKKDGEVENEDFASALHRRGYGVTYPHDDLPECREKQRNMKKDEANHISLHDESPQYYSKCSEARLTEGGSDVRLLHPVTHGLLASQCSSFTYIPETDTLSCEDGTRTMLLKDPYSCDDIRVTLDGQLLCF